MLRATMTAPGRIEFSHEPRPQIGDDDVLVRILRIGICGSDIHVYHGKHPYTSYPVVQGHEFSGEVVETGKRAARFSPGDLVTALPQITCGACPPCLSGRYNICDDLKVMGFQAPGVAQEYFAFPQAALLALPSGFTPENGAFVEPAAVATHAVARAGDVTGANVLVLGAGPIGNLVAQVALWRGARSVMITDVSPWRLDVARGCGIPLAVDTATTPLEAEVARVWGSAKASVVFECAALSQTMGEAIRCAMKGGVIVVVGVFAEPPVVDAGLIQDRELELRGTLMYRREDYESAVEALAQGRVRPSLSKTFPFRHYPEAYRYIEENRDRVMKIMVDLETPDH